MAQKVDDDVKISASEGLVPLGVGGPGPVRAGAAPGHEQGPAPHVRAGPLRDRRLHRRQA